MDLDDKARSALAELPEDARQKLLDELMAKGSDEVRNVSAYITKAARQVRRDLEQDRPHPERARGVSAVEPTAEEAAKISDAIIQFALDDKASRLLRSLEPQQALSLIESMGDGVRNPSAFITKAAHDRVNQPGVEHSRSGLAEPSGAPSTQAAAVAAAAQSIANSLLAAAAALMKPGEAKPPVSSASRKKDEARIQDAVIRFGLDEKATRGLRMLSPAEAVLILDSMGDSARNPSAFITKATNDRLHAPGAKVGGRGAPELDIGAQLAAAAAALTAPSRIDQAKATHGLDDKATRLLRKMEPSEAVALLDSMGEGVRNPSAFITKAVHDRVNHPELAPASGVAGRGGRGTPEATVKDAIARLGLDSKASSALMQLDASEAVGILESMGDGVRNKSAFITKAVNDRVQGFDPDAKRRVAGGAAAAGAGYTTAAAAPRSQTPGHIEEIRTALGLDDKATRLLSSLDDAEITSLLESMGGSLRNPSAFITKAVHDRVNRPEFDKDSLDDETRLDEAIMRFGLDDTCVRALRALETAEALHIIDSMGASVRNPSAFITRAANDRLHGEGRLGGSQASLTGVRLSSDEAEGRVEDAVARLGLDDKATRLLRSLDPADAVTLLDSMGDTARNPSAFITKAAHDRFSTQVAKRPRLRA